MAKQKVIPGPHQPQFEVSPEALTSELALFSPSFLSSYVSLCSKNPKRTIWQHKVQVGVAKMQELIDKKLIDNELIDKRLIPNNTGVELLKNTIQSKQVGRVQSLLERLENKLSNEEVNQLVKSAIDSDQVAIVDALATSDQININSFRYGGELNGVLHYALKFLRFGIAKVLANNPKIDINYQASGCNTVLHWILRIADEINKENDLDKADQLQQLVEVVEILVSRKIEVNVRNCPEDMLPLDQAIKYNNFPIFKVLLTHPNIDIKVQGDYMTPLDRAVGCDRFDMVQELLAKYYEQGIDTNDLTKALFHVQSREVFKLLVACGADIDAKVGTQSFAEKCNSDDQYFQKQKEWLLEYGINLKSTKSSDPHTPLTLPIQANNTDIDSAVKSKQEVPEEKQDTDIHLAGEVKQEVQEEAQEGA